MSRILLAAVAVLALAGGDAAAQLTVDAPGLFPSTPASQAQAPCDNRGEAVVTMQVSAEGRAQWVMVEFEKPVGCGWAQVVREIVERYEFKPYRVNGIAVDSPTMRYLLRIEPRQPVSGGTRMAGNVTSPVPGRIMTLLPLE